VTGTPKYILDQIVYFVWGAFIFYVGYLAIGVTQEAFVIGKTTPALDWQMGWMYAIIPVTFILMSLRVLQRMFVRHVEWIKEYRS